MCERVFIFMNTLEYKPLCTIHEYEYKPLCTIHEYEYKRVCSIHDSEYVFKLLLPQWRHLARAASLGPWAALLRETAAAHLNCTNAQRVNLCEPSRVLCCTIPCLRVLPLDPQLKGTRVGHFLTGWCGP